MPTLPEALQLVQTGGSTGLLILAVLGGFKGWYVWRWQYDASQKAAERELAQMRQERDDWKAVATRGLAVAEKVTG